MKFGKTIKIFLIDGDPNGRMSCELSNWSGKAYKIPRIKVKDCSDREDLTTSTGVYLLFGKDDDGKEQVYIGEAETILKRLNQQLTSKDFWNETIVFISKDDNLNKAHIKYLESRQHEIAKSANRYKVDNSIVPTQSSISESDRAEMEEFIEYIKLLVNTLGHKVFEEKREFKPKQKQATFFIKAARGADGQGEPTSDGFVVFKGSKAAATIVNSMTSNFITYRQKLIDEGVLVDKGDFFEFTDDYIFSSPSTAAVMVMGRNANGLTEWKSKDGKTLKDFETNEKTTKP
ncbi:GIY-YIG nuclease family protein [Flavobacterium aurantiibacter]|uniref:Methionine sulfoxide reductase n=1 Tax=Flavobacterium aurantiibacter TaxID=2023067 RepID=A0A255ZW26_9FLAO|nr:GIY-YIG nuclease family protein [Flavobacterium aurantiibacter]OYQ45646.1 methionine sulfoxide reductase [Flavobacterium aurantiibacter]